MASPFSTNELFLRSDRIAFGKIPPEVPSREERLLLVPNLPGYTLYFGLSSLISTNATSGTLEAIYPQEAAFAFDNLNKRLGIGISSPQFGIDIATTTGVRISGGTLIANAMGLQSVPTAALISTLPSYLFAPGTIPPTAIASTGGIVGISVPTSALFSTLPTSLFAPSSIPLGSLQSTGVIYASSFIANSLYGDGFNVSNIPLANINGDITGNFFKPNTIPLSSLASTGQIWIRDGSLFVPVFSTAQAFASSLTLNTLSAQSIEVSQFVASTILTGNLVFASLSTNTIETSSIRAIGGITAGYFTGNGGGLTNLDPAALNNVIPSDKFGYRLIAWDAINPYGNFEWIAGTVTFRAAAPVTIQGTLTVAGSTILNTVNANFYSGNGSGLVNLNAVSSLSLVSSLRGLGSLGYVSSSQLLSTVAGLTQLISSASVGDQELVSTVAGLGTAGYVSTLSLQSSITGLGTAGYVSTPSLVSTTIAFQTAGFLSSLNLLSTVTGLGTTGYVSTLSLQSSVTGLGTAGYVSTLSLQSSVTGLGTAGYVSTLSLQSTLTGLGSSGYISSSQLLSTTQGLETYISTFIDPTELTSSILSTVAGLAVGPNLQSTVTGLGSSGYVSTLSLVSATVAFQTAGFLSSLNLVSTVTGLGSSAYISSSQLLSTTQGLETYISTFIDPTELTSSIVSTVSGLAVGSNLQSTVIGLGSSGYISTLSLQSSITGLGSSGYVSTLSLQSTLTGLGSSGYISSSQLLSTTQGLETYISTFIDPTELTSSIVSTVSGLAIGSNLQSTVTGLGSSGYISTLSLQSSIIGLGSSGYISSLSLTSSLISTTDAMNLAISSFSTAFGPGGIALPNITSTVEGLGSSGYISSLQLLSTTQGLETYISTFIDPTELTSSIVSTVSGLAIGSNLQSTVIGLGSSGYISTLSLQSSILGLGSSGYISSLSLTSSLISTTNAMNLAISSFSTAFGPGGITLSHVTSTVEGLGSSGYISSSQLLSTTQGLETYISTFVDPQELASSVLQFISSIYFTSQLTSTVTGLGSSGYISSLSLTSSLISTTDAMDVAISSFSTAFGPGGIALPNITSTVEGLGAAGYVSTLSLVSTTLSLTYEYGTGLSTLSTAIYNAPFVYPGQLLYLNYSISSGTSNYKTLQTTPLPLNAGVVVSTPIAGNTISTVAAFQSDFFIPTFIPAGFWENRLFTYASGNNVTAFTELYDRSPSGVESLIKTTSTATTSILAGTSPQEYIINMNVPYTPISTGHTVVWKIFASNSAAVSRTMYSYFENGNTYSYLITTFGGTAGYNFPAAFSSLALFTSNTSNYFASQLLSTNSNLVSTVSGLGSSGYVSSLSLLSTVEGLGSSGYISSSQLLSTTRGLETYISTFIDTTELTSSIVSTVSGLAIGSNLQSTVTGLGSSGYISTLSLTSSLISTTRFISLSFSSFSTAFGPGGGGGLASIPSTLSTFAFFTSSILASTIQTIVLSSQQLITSSLTANTAAISSALISSLSTSIINFATGFGYLTMPDIIPNTVYTSTVTTSNLLVGWNSVISPIQFFGFGNYTNSVIAELSTGATTQELVTFRGSNSSDRIRFQTTGSIVFEPGVSARLWPTVPSNVTPAMILNINSNVGIQIAAPTVPLDVNGAIRAVTLSTQQIATSSIINNPTVQGAFFNSSLRVGVFSTFFGGAMSTSFMTAGPPEVDFYTNNLLRMTILSNGNVGIGTAAPAFLLDVAGTARMSTLFVSSATAFNSFSTVLLQTSSLLGNNVQGTTLSSVVMGASSFTGRWNDAQYYVLQSI